MECSVGYTRDLATVSVTGAEQMVAQVQRAFATLVPPNVAVKAVSVGKVDDLFEVERILVERAVASRRSEFAAGRWCARRALEGIGAAATPILRGSLHEPLWPRGCGGSITHDGGIAVAAAHRTQLNGTTLRLGIDLIDCTDRARLSEIASVILSERDRAVLLDRTETALGIAEVFSAKEAAVKILATVLGGFVELVDVRIQPHREGFSITHPGSELVISSRMDRVGEFLATVATASIAIVGKNDVDGDSNRLAM